MSLDTYANLKIELADKIARSDITSTSSIIDTAIDLVEAEANTELRLQQMLYSAEVDIASGEETADLPNDFLQAYNLYLEDDPSPLTLDTEENLRKRYPRSQIGRPKSWTPYIQNTALFAPVADTDYTSYLTYYAKIPALSDSNSTNWLLSTYPGYYYYGALRHLFVYIVDPEAQAQIAAELQLVKTAIKNAEVKKRTVSAGMQAHTVGMTP